MYDKILVAVDQSPVVERVLAATGELARLSGGEVRVLHLRERELMGGRGGIVDYETGEEARATADRAVRALTQDGIKASGEARNTPFGHAAREIIGEARNSVPGSSSWDPGATAIWPGWCWAARRIR